MASRSPAGKDAVPVAKTKTQTTARTVAKTAAKAATKTVTKAVAKTVAKTATQTAAPKAGRRPRGADGTAPLSREGVIACAVRLARTEPITELSMVRVARELGVAPGLVHYYVGSRDDLLSAVLNVAFKERCEALPPMTGRWQDDLAGIARSTVAATERWPGLGVYIMTRSRLRLFQRVGPGETDHGLVYFDRVGRVLKASGFPSDKAAMVYHTLMLFVVNIAVDRENRQAPAVHKDFIRRYVGQFDPEDVPGAAFLVQPFSEIDNERTFEVGLALLIQGFGAWRTAPAPPPAKRPARA